MKTYLTISFVIMLVIGVSAPIQSITAPIDAPVSNSWIMSSDQNTVTLPVDGTNILFLGEDVWAEAEQYFPGLTDNETVLNLMNKYSDELLFITRTPRSEYVKVVAMNESMYAELLIECTFEHNLISEVIAIEETCSSTYMDSLRNALSTIMTENVTQNLNLTSWEQRTRDGGIPVMAHLWSYNYTGRSLWSGDSPSPTLYSIPDADDLLSQVHWEIITMGYVTMIVSMGDPNPAMWEVDEALTFVVFSVDQSGDIIQIYYQVFPVGDTNNPTIIIVIGVGVVSLVALIVVFYRRRY